jgi:hypothetical protein
VYADGPPSPSHFFELFFDTFESNKGTSDTEEADVHKTITQTPQYKKLQPRLLFRLVTKAQRQKASKSRPAKSRRRRLIQFLLNNNREREVTMGQKQETHILLLLWVATTPWPPRGATWTNHRFVCMV